MLGNLKKWAQHKAFPAEDKFGQMRQIRPKTLMVTSNFQAVFFELFMKVN